MTLWHSANDSKYRKKKLLYTYIIHTGAFRDGPRDTHPREPPKIRTPKITSCDTSTSFVRKEKKDKNKKKKVDMEWMNEWFRLKNKISHQYHINTRGWGICCCCCFFFFLCYVGPFLWRPFSQHTTQWWQPSLSDEYSREKNPGYIFFLDSA